MKDFKNKTTFIPYDRVDEAYTNTLNCVIEDERLSLISVGIYVYIQKFKNFYYDGKRYIIVKEVIQKRSGLGYDLFTKHWNLLVKCGYINVKRIKGGYEYEFIEKPVRNTSNEDRVTSPTFGKKTNCQKTNCQNAILEIKDKRKQIQEENLSTQDLSPKATSLPDSLFSAKAENPLSVTDDTSDIQNPDVTKKISPKLELSFNDQLNLNDTGFGDDFFDDIDIPKKSEIKYVKL